MDFLRASGMHLDEAAGELDGAVRNAFLLTPVLLRRTLERSDVKGLGTSGRAARVAS